MLLQLSEHLELLTAVLEKEPVVGMDWTKEPKMLQSPSATISWLASTDLPPAAGTLDINITSRQ